jgi:hypothetical protein
MNQLKALILFLFIGMIALMTWLFSLPKGKTIPRNETASLKQTCEVLNQQLLVNEQLILDLQHYGDSLFEELQAERLSANRNKSTAARIAKTDQHSRCNDSIAVLKDSISHLFNDCIVIQVNADSTCAKSVRSLEQLLGNAQRELSVFCQVEDNLRDREQQYELRIQQLSNELDTAYKVQKRKAESNRLISSGLKILSSLITSLYVWQTLK